MSEHDTVDMGGKVVVVTGANAGIGRATALALAHMGARVLACGRDEARLNAAVEVMRRVTGNQQVEALVADLSSVAEVRSLAASIIDRAPRLDVLINNAGVAVNSESRTADDLELTFAVNYMAPFVLTTELLPLLKESAPSRVVTVSSAMHTAVKRLDLDDLPRPRRFSWRDAYGRSKLANILFTRALARRLAGARVTATSLHPGVIATDFGGDGDLTGVTGWLFGVAKYFLPGPDAGARTSVYLASSPEVEGRSGGYYEKCREKAPSKLAQDDELAERLWRLSEELAGQA